MKGTLMSVSDRLLLRKRAIIETMNDELKTIVQAEYSRHRCLKKSSSTYSGQLLPIICSQRSRASMCKGSLTHSLHCSEFVELTLIKTTNITRNTKKTRNLKKIIVFLALHNIDSYICDNKRKMPHYQYNYLTNHTIKRRGSRKAI